MASGSALYDSGADDGATSATRPRHDCASRQHGPCAVRLSEHQIRPGAIPAAPFEGGGSPLSPPPSRRRQAMVVRRTPRPLALLAAAGVVSLIALVWRHAHASGAHGAEERACRRSQLQL